MRDSKIAERDTPLSTGFRRSATSLALVAGACVLLVGLIALLNYVTLRRAIARAPVRGNAIVVATYINGFGGDPGFDHTYAVDGRSYTGSATGGYQDGEPVAIEYAGREPSKSCACNVIGNTPPPSPTVILAALITGVAVAAATWLRIRKTASPDLLASDARSMHESGTAI